jgi:hypothetical protein
MRSRPSLLALLLAFLPVTYAPRETSTYPPRDARPHIPLKFANLRCLPLRGDVRVAFGMPMMFSE